MRIIMRIVKILVLVVFLVVLAAIGALGWFGFVPGLSNLLGANNPRDLGVTYTEQDLQSARAKLGVELLELPPGLPPKESREYSGQIDVRVSLTQEELTALVNDKRWRFHPVSDAQIRINDDGSVEFSGKLLVGRLDDLLDSFEVDQEDMGLLKDSLRFFITDPAFYAKASFSVTNDVVSLDMQKTKVGRLGVPAGRFTDDQARIDSITDRLKDNITGLSIASLTFEGGRMELNGTFPATEAVSPDE